MGLWWEWETYTLPSGKTVDDVKDLVAGNTQYGLPSLGYSDIVVAADVHGEKSGVIAAVAYLPKAGRDYWQVLNCNGDRTDLNELIDQIRILHNAYF